MKPIERLCRCSLALQLFVAVYLCAMFGLLPILKYYPTLHLWETGSIKGPPAMSWFCFTAYALLAAGIGYLLGGLYAKLQERLKFDLAGASACVAMLAFAACSIWHEAHKWL
ncbi:MAG TPA: hypothetical protein VGP72_03445 [Planctomycetota bacterium]|jgi:hypothetical protein